MEAETRTAYDLFENELGWALAVADGGRLIRLSHVDGEEEALRLVARDHPGAVRDGEAAPLPALRRQLAEYLAGERREFELPLAPRGTEFQRAVWRALQGIPYGELRSYVDLAEELDNPGASRAVGQANAHNPIGVVIPCHRVIAADGGIGGYTGGLHRKEHLLTLERAPLQTHLRWSD